MFTDDPNIDSEIGKHQIITNYEIAAGSDMRYPNTRENIHPFINVGLSKTWTFSDLDLVARTATYYITVRAYSSNRAMVEVTSNGIKVGYGGIIISLGDIELEK